MAADPFKAHLNPPALGRELDGVGEEIPETLLQATWVAANMSSHWIEHDVKLDVLRLGGMVHRGDGGVHSVLQVHRLHVHAHFAGDDAAHVQQIFDELGLRLGIAFDDYQAFLKLLVVAAARAEDLGPSKNGVQRSAQFVRQGGQELVLEEVDAVRLGAGGTFGFEEALALLGGSFGIVVEAGIVDRSGGLGGDPRNDPLGAFGKDASR